MLGSVKLTGPNGRNAWTIWQGATPLGVFFPLVELEAAGTPRIRPDTARITAVARNARRTIVDMILSRAGQDGSGGGTSSTNTAELFESGWRFVIPSKGSWMACSCLWIRNTSSKPWKLLGIHHCVLPASDAQRVASTSLLEGMPNYYRSGAAWVNSAANNGVGCWFADEKAFRCLFWKDSQGILHSELRQVLRKTLKPGEKMEVKGPPSFVFPMLHASLTSFSDVVAEIEKTALTGK